MVPLKAAAPLRVFYHAGIAAIASQPCVVPLAAPPTRDNCGIYKGGKLMPPPSRCRWPSPEPGKADVVLIRHLPYYLLHFGGVARSASSSIQSYDYLFPEMQEAFRGVWQQLLLFHSGQNISKQGVQALPWLGSSS